VALGSEAGYLRLLHGKSLARVHGALAHCLACRLQLPASPFGQRHGPEPAEHIVGRPLVLACFHSPLLAAQPLAVHQEDASEMDRDAAVPDAVNRLRYRESAAGPALSNARDRAWMPSAPFRPGCGCPLTELPQGRGSLVAGAALGSCLDELGQGLSEETQVLVVACPPGADQGGLIAAQIVTQHRSGIRGEPEHPPPPLAVASRTRALISSSAGFPVSPGAENQRDIPQDALPVAAVMASASSISPASAPNSPACTSTRCRASSQTAQPDALVRPAC
jgi:hypothetical protein